MGMPRVEYKWGHVGSCSDINLLCLGVQGLYLGRQGASFAPFFLSGPSSLL